MKNGINAKTIIGGLATMGATQLLWRSQLFKSKPVLVEPTVVSAITKNPYEEHEYTHTNNHRGGPRIF